MTSRIAVKSPGDQQDSCEVSRKSLGTSRIAVVSRKILDTSRIALQSLGRDQQESWEVSMTSLRTSRMAAESLKRALGPAG